jgi:cephalosporin hydroxylase
MVSGPESDFRHERNEAISKMSNDAVLKRRSLEWMINADKYKYTYNFSWMGRPIIKYPNDILVQQEIIWDIRPDLIIETGIAHGGSLIFSASMMDMMGIDGEVVGIDIDIRQHNKLAIESHPVFERITMYEGDSASDMIVDKVSKHLHGKKCVMVILDSLHTHNHVYKELVAYSPMVTVGSYCILPDTFIEFFPKGYYSSDRPWDVGNNPYTAMKQFLSETSSFEIDQARSSKAVITESIDGYLLRVK